MLNTGKTYNLKKKIVWAIKNFKLFWGFPETIYEMSHILYIEEYEYLVSWVHLSYRGITF